MNTWRRRASGFLKIGMKVSESCHDDQNRGASVLRNNCRSGHSLPRHFPVSDHVDPQAEKSAETSGREKPHCAEAKLSANSGEPRRQNLESGRPRQPAPERPGSQRGPRRRVPALPRPGFSGQTLRGTERCSSEAEKSGEAPPGSCFFRGKNDTSRFRKKTA